MQRTLKKRVDGRERLLRKKLVQQTPNLILPLTKLYGNSNSTISSEALNLHNNSLKAKKSIKQNYLRKFKTIEAQREFMEKLFIEFKMKSLEEFLTLEKYKFIQKGGRSLLQYHRNDILSLLKCIYPNYGWEETTERLRNREQLNSLEKQQLRMQQIYEKLQLKTLDDWLKVKKTEFIQTNGKNLLKRYSNRLSVLLLSIYPNYPWDFTSLTNKYQRTTQLQSIEYQRELMEYLFIHQYRFESLHDWLTLSTPQFILHGGSELLLQYNHNYEELLVNLYPYYPWPFIHHNHHHHHQSHVNNKSMIEDDNTSIKQQRKRMDAIYEKLQFKELDDWLKAPITLLMKNGAYYLLKKYKYNLNALLTSTYPHYGWDFTIKFDHLKDRRKFKSIESERKFMDHLFKEFRLRWFDDWYDVSRNKISKHGGKGLIKYYKRNIMKLLNCIYPNYPWDSSKHISSSSSIIHQRFRMDQIYHTLKLNCLDDWLTTPQELIIINGGSKLLNYYKFKFYLLLSSIYPYYPWDFLQAGKITKSHELKMKSIHYKRRLMQRLFYKFQLNSLDDWLNVSRDQFLSRGGEKFISYFSDFHSLLSSLYPNFAWHFHSSDNFFLQKLPLSSSIEKNRNFMDSIYHQFGLQSLAQWKQIPREDFIKMGGRKLLRKYSNQFNSLLSSIYPNYPWKFRKRISLHSIDHQREFLSQLFFKFQLSDLNDFQFISIDRFISNGGELLIKLYHQNIQQLLSSVFPNFPWNFSQIPFESTFNFRSIDHQVQYMEQLFIQLQLTSLDDWLQISRKKIINNGGEKLIKFYSNNRRSLLSSLYPNFPWNFSQIPLKFEKLISISSRRELMDKLFYEFKLKSMDDWLRIPNTKIIAHGGDRILNHYHYDLSKALSAIYPYYPWDFSSYLLTVRISVNSIFNQRKKMDQLFRKLKLTSLDDWMKISRSILISKIGSQLSRKYRNNLFELFPSTYPYFPWDFQEYLSNFRFKSIDSQREFMDQLFNSLQFKSFNDFYSLTRKQINSHGGKIILNYYRRNIQSLLSSLYPNYPWEFISAKSMKLKGIIDKYYITRKIDWYRIPRSDFLTIYSFLPSYYPDEDWNFSNFSLRSKKASQRLLFALTHKLYPSLLLFENYLHPKLLSDNNQYELDVFIPALQLALEYQGCQHYDDLPAVFPGLESCLIRDEVKVKIAADLAIKIVYIPYWWDQSLSSLQSSLQSV